MTVMTRHNWPFVINLGNSIIGVSILAMPFCFKQCGIILGTVLLLSSTWLTLVSSQLLINAGIMSRRRSYEFLAYYTYGHAGKLIVEVGCIGLNVGSCIAFFVIIGDLGPAIISKMFDIENSSQLRSGLMIFLAVCVALPLGLLRNIESLSSFSALSITFYTVFVFYIFTLAGPTLWMGNWIEKVNFWRMEGLFQCLPIFSMAFACQTQLFILYDAMPEPSLKAMNSVVSSAVNICTAAYLLTGFFGYVTFCDQTLGGDVLTLFPSTFLAQIMQLCFVLSIAISFPLVIFPCRAAIFTLCFPQKPKSHDEFTSENWIPTLHFRVITVSIVLGTLIVGINVPNVEFVLGLCGATMGTLVSYILPAIFFIKVASNMADGRISARLVLVLGTSILLMSTYTVLHTQHQKHDEEVVVHKPVKDELMPLTPPVGGHKDGNVLDQVKDKDKVDKIKADDKRNVPPADGNKDEKQIEAPKEKDKDQQDEAKKDGRRQEPPIPLEPIDSIDKQRDVVDKAVVDVKDDEDKPNKVADKIVVKDDVENVEKREAKKAELTDEELKAKAEEKLEKAEESRKQKELLAKLEEQQESQKRIIEEERKILAEIKQHHDQVHNKPVNDGQQPIVQQPVVQLPVGLQPVGQQPVGQQPVGQQQVVQQPVGQQQVVQQPVGQQLVGQQPVGQQQVGQQPVQQQQVGQQPVQQQQVGQQPVGQQPVGQQQMVQQAVGQQPVGQGQIAQNPVGQLVQQPLGQQQVVQQPLGQQVIQQPVGQQMVQQAVGQQPVGQGQLVQQPIGQQLVQQPVGQGQWAQQAVGQQQIVQQAVGQQLVQQPAGQQVIQQPAGQQVVQQPAGQQVVQQPAGQQVVQQPFGQLPVGQGQALGQQQLVQQPMGQQQFIQQPLGQQQITQQPIGKLPLVQQLGQQQMPQQVVQQQPLGGVAQAGGLAAQQPLQFQQGGDLNQKQNAGNVQNMIIPVGQNVGIQNAAEGQQMLQNLGLVDNARLNQPNMGGANNFNAAVQNPIAQDNRGDDPVRRPKRDTADNGEGIPEGDPKVVAMEIKKDTNDNKNKMDEINNKALGVLSNDNVVDSEKDLLTKAKLEAAGPGRDLKHVVARSLKSNKRSLGRS